uniref:JmjC domain-containing protein n=1 Tax=Arcella intermedia TaxID=1963864 RepID=A0A6B2L4Q4_9EUKA
MYFSQTGNIREAGTGYLAFLSDDMIEEIFMLFDHMDLCRMAQVSKTMYVFAGIDVLWKPICIDQWKGDFKFQGTWKKTFAWKMFNHQIVDANPPINASGLYSDRLYQSWFCAQVSPYLWTKVENIERRSNLSLEEFRTEYEAKNKPVIITDVLNKWEISKWTREDFLQKLGDRAFKTDFEQTEMKLADYFTYCDTVKEERPIYLFDNSFCERAPEMDKSFGIPSYFPDDYFNLLNVHPEHRPSWRWFLVGPPRSGATFHKDPNFTSAWHGLLIGKKKWIMYPPEVVPIGIFPSADGQQVTGPDTMVQWFMDFYKEKAEVDPIECTLHAGEMMFIPSAWWHSVLNLETSVAITQNYVSKYNLKSVYNFLKSKKHQNLFQLFHQELEKNHPEDLAQILKEEHTKPKTGEMWKNFVGDEEEDANWTLNF